MIMKKTELLPFISLGKTLLSIHLKNVLEKATKENYENISFLGTSSTKENINVNSTSFSL